MLIEIHEHLCAPPEAVFGVLTDHERLAGLPGITSSRLLRPGTPEPRGVGALRELRIRGARFVEEVVGFSPPNRFDYRIRESSLPLQHEHGEIEVECDGNGSRVLWRSVLTVPIPIVGRLAQPVVRRLLERSFRAILVGVEARLRAADG